MPADFPVIVKTNWEKTFPRVRCPSLEGGAPLPEFHSLLQLENAKEKHVLQSLVSPALHFTGISGSFTLPVLQSKEHQAALEIAMGIITCSGCWMYLKDKLHMKQAFLP